MGKFNLKVGNNATMSDVNISTVSFVDKSDSSIKNKVKSILKNKEDSSVRDTSKYSNDESVKRNRVVRKKKKEEGTKGDKTATSTTAKGVKSVVLSDEPAGPSM